MASSLSRVSTVGVDQHFELRQLRMQAVLNGERKLGGEFELIGGGEFGLDLQNS
jgi:hypothetical protein